MIKQGNKNMYETGVNHPAYKNGSGLGYNYRNVEKSIMILGYSCNRCKSNKNVNLHHIDGNPKNNAIQNWERLCRVCHMKEHWKSRSLTVFQKIQRYENYLLRLKIKRGYTPVPDGYVIAIKAAKILGVSRQFVQYLTKAGFLKYKTYVFHNKEKIIYSIENLHKRKEERMEKGCWKIDKL